MDSLIKHVSIYEHRKSLVKFRVIRSICGDSTSYMYRTIFSEIFGVPDHLEVIIAANVPLRVSWKNFFAYIVLVQNTF